jgi:hypothetical protein
MRGRVCSLQLLLAFDCAIILWPGPGGAQDHISLSLNLPSTNTVAQLYTSALRSLFVFYDWKGFELTSMRELTQMRLRLRLNYGQRSTDFSFSSLDLNVFDYQGGRPL